jgi:hypothetical protein
VFVAKFLVTVAKITDAQMAADAVTKGNDESTFAFKMRKGKTFLDKMKEPVKDLGRGLLTTVSDGMVIISTEFTKASVDIGTVDILQRSTETIG